MDLPLKGQTILWTTLRSSSTLTHTHQIPSNDARYVGTLKKNQEVVLCHKNKKRLQRQRPRESQPLNKDFTKQRSVSTHLILGGAPCSRSPQKPPQYIWGPLFPCGPPCRRWWFHLPRWRWRRCGRSPRPSPGYRPRARSYPHPLKGKNKWKSGQLDHETTCFDQLGGNLCVKFWNDSVEDPWCAGISS